MQLPSIFKLPKYKVFEYKPRYWNPRKEALEARIEHVKRQIGEGKRHDENGNYIPNLKGYFQSVHSGRFVNQRRRANEKYNSRLLFILMILCLLAFFLLFG